MQAILSILLNIFSTVIFKYYQFYKAVKRYNIRHTNLHFSHILPYTNQYRSKYKILLLLFGLLLFYNSTFAQISIQGVEDVSHNNNPTLHIQVNEHETSHLIFPTEIIYFDVGDSEHYAADYTNNILRIKGQAANDAKYHQTNLTVITTDNAYYSFYVHYMLHPKLNYFIKKIDSTPILNKNNKPDDSLSKDHQNIRQRNNTEHSNNSNYNQPHRMAQNRESSIPINRSNINQPNIIHEQSIYSIHKTAQQILEKPPLYNQFDILTNNIRSKHGDIELKLKGIHHSLKYCYFFYEVKNHGAIPYDISYIEIGVREKRRSKRAALNEDKLNVIYTLNEDISRVLPYRINRYVAVLDKLAVSEDRICYLEIIEDGRNITLKIPYNKLKIGAIKEQEYSNKY